tara:strand:- start:693 stop:881 length:189 start_codon:yes stop_codon:yes gene_type:complete
MDNFLVDNNLHEKSPRDPQADGLPQDNEISEESSADKGLQAAGFKNPDMNLSAFLDRSQRSN